jgi:hypothetical protein
MSIKAMTWAFALPLEPRAKFVLVAIGDNARDDGVAWPSRDNIAKKSSQSRATVNRRLRILSELGVIQVKERFREDGTQTTDEIRLNLDLTPDDVEERIKARKKGDKTGDEADDDDDNEELGDAPEGGGCQADTLGVQSSNPGAAVVTGGGLHSCDPQDEPSDEQEIPPNPPSGGVSAGDGPLRKGDREAEAMREELWKRLLGAYPGISAMDQQAAREEFFQLALDDAEWAVSSAQPYGAECSKLRKPPKNAHIWLRKAMFKNFPRGGPAPARPDSYAADSPEGRAVLALHQVVRKTIPTIAGRVTYRGEITPQLLAFAQARERSAWPWIESSEATRDQIAAWARFIETHVPGPRGTLLETKGLGEAMRSGIHAPWPWPPKKDGSIYQNPASPEETDDHA